MRVRVPLVAAAFALAGSQSYCSVFASTGAGAAGQSVGA